jgi:Polyketide cyclase / dehydrase and lipid transport
MGQTHLSAERLVDAPADVVYHCLADYRAHHRPGGFLPPVFADLRIERGGVGAGTVITFTVTLAGRSRALTLEVSEPEPGRVLVEAGRRERTTFTVEPVGERARVRFDTVLEAGGIEGLVNRLVAARLLRPLYADELERLERHARAHLAVGIAPDHAHAPSPAPAA